MTKVYFIDPNGIKQHPTFIQKNIEDSILGPTILRVQETMIRPILGQRLYARLVEGVDNNDLNAYEQTLISDYLIDAIIAGGEMRSVVHTTKRIRNKGTGNIQDETFRPLPDNEAKPLKDLLRSDFDVYRESIICYLRDNYLLYPEYYADGEPGHCYCEIKPDRGRPYKNISLNI